MKEFLIRAKKVAKKVVALSVGAAMLGATMGGAVAAADLSNLSKAGTVLNASGMFDAYVVVGKTADPADIVGSIDVGIAFGQKAQSAAGTGGSGSATLSVQTFKGSKNENARILENVTTAQTADYHSQYIANYTKIVNSTLNWTTLQKAEITKADVLKDTSLNIPKGNVKLWVKLQREMSGITPAINETMGSAASIGGYMKLFGTEYYVVNWTNENITLGTSTTYADKALPATVTTSSGYTITAEAGATGKVIVQITKPDGTQSTLVEKGQGQSTSFGDVTVAIDSVLGSSYVSLTVVASSKSIKNNDKYPDSNWAVNIGDGVLTFTSENAVSLSAPDTYALGPGGEFRMDYVSLKTSGYYTNVTIFEGQKVTIKVTANSSSYCELARDYPGITLYNWTGVDTNPVTQAAEWREVTNVGGARTSAWFKLKEPDGSYFTVNCSKDDTQYMEVSYYNGTDNTVENVVKKKDGTSGTGISVPFYVTTTGSNVTAVGIDNVAFEVVGTRIDVNGTTDAQGNNALNGTFWVRRNVDGVYQSGKITKPVGFGLNLTFEGENGDSNDKVIAVEPDGTKHEVKFNDTADGLLLDTTSSDIGATDGQNTTYGSTVRFNSTAVSDDYYTTAANVTYEVPEKKATYGIGSYVYTSEKAVAAGSTGTFDETVVKVSSVTGVNINYLTPGIGRLSDDSVLTTPTKPLVLVGGPEANPVVASAGITSADFKINGTWWSGHALVKLMEKVSALNNQTVLVIAGVNAMDTVWASRLVAKELVNNMASPLVLNGTEVWLGTSVTSVDSVTKATK